MNQNLCSFVGGLSFGKAKQIENVTFFPVFRHTEGEKRKKLSFSALDEAIKIGANEILHLTVFPD